MISYMKKIALAGALAIMATGAQAITVPLGEQLILQLSGFYQTDSGDDIAEGETLNFFGVQVSNINATAGVDLDGLSPFSVVGVSGPFVFANGGGNSGLSFTFADGGSSVFTLASSFNLTLPVTPTGTYSLDGLGDLDGEAGSFGFSTTGTGTGGAFTMSVAVPPIVEPPIIPLPAAAPLLLGALGALALARRKVA